MSAESKIKYGWGRIGVAAAAFFQILYLGLRHMGVGDFTYVLMWWFTLLVLGLAMQPLALVLFKRFYDGGWVFSKALGIVICGWLMWVLASVKLLKFRQSTCIACILICLLAGICLFYYLVIKKQRKYEWKEFYNPERLTSMIVAEVIFFGAFVFWCFLKGKNAEAYGTERFMDYGFMLSMVKGDYMPPVDMWFSGKPINYYYVGQYYAAFITKTADIPVSYGYNLAMMMIAAFGFCMPYSLVSNIFRTKLMEKQEEDSAAIMKHAQRNMMKLYHKKAAFWFPGIAGTLGGLAIGFCGTMHYTVYKLIVPKVRNWLGMEPLDNYWFPSATRFIGEFYERDDKPIHEFPIYSYVIGDLHAHVINTIFVMTLLAILFAWLLRRNEMMKRINAGDTDARPFDYKTEIFRPELIVCAFLIGVFHMTNTWDFPIYFVVSGAIILFSNLILYPKSSRAWILTAYQAVLFIVIGAVTCLPFTLAFDSMSKGIGVTGRHTLFVEFMIIWGLPVTCVCAFLIKIIPEALDRKKRYGFLANLSVSDLYVFTIGLCALGLIFIPEFIYIPDIYGEAYERANTVFKVTYQAFIMIGISMAYIITRFLFATKGVWVKIFACFAMFLLLTTAGYSRECFHSWFVGEYKTMDGSAFISRVNRDDAEMIEYINNSIKGQPVILEMGGVGYTFFGRISVFTGNPTVSGWQAHEWLWRCSGNFDKPEELNEREADVITLYTSRDAEEIQRLIDKYDIDYIYIGQNERTNGYEQSMEPLEDYMAIDNYYYHKIDTNTEILLQLGEIVKMIPEDGSKDYATYLVKVRKTVQ